MSENTDLLQDLANACFDQAAALKQGWFLADEDHGFVIERCDTAAKFKDDVAAREFVIGRAIVHGDQNAGLALAIEALDKALPED
jgi:hypothetical protein